MDTTKQEYSAAPPLHLPIDVSEVSSLPEPFDVVAFANFLLTSLLKHDSGVLRGEFKDGVGYWFVRSLPDGKEVEIGRQDSIGCFRMVLARFGYWYMAVQLYGGSAQRALFHHERRYDCCITMSNDNRFGYSLTVYAKVHMTWIAADVLAGGIQTPLHIFQKLSVNVALKPNRILNTACWTLVLIALANSNKYGKVSSNEKLIDCMKTINVRDVIDREPFKPLTIELDNGKTFKVPHRDFISLNPSGSTAVIYEEEHVHVIDVEHISAVTLERRRKTSH